MENNRFLKFFVLLIWGGALMSPFLLHAYDGKTTHPALTQEIIKFYNKSFSENHINSDDASSIMLGSTEEDKDPRWLRHFYDPVYKRGLVLENNAFPQNNDFALIGSAAKSYWESSKDWAEDIDSQRGVLGGSTTAGIFSDYFSGTDDYSWNRAVYDYAWGNKKRGLLALGHVLHLLEDSSVPDHTRNDPHPPILDMGSPYEMWTKKFDPKHISIEFQNEKPIILGNLGNYFDSLATYSNTNFFSRDSVCQHIYESPQIKIIKRELLSDHKIYSFVYDITGTYRLALKLPEKSFEPQCSYVVDDNDNLILNDYWNLLSKQAVLHGAGVVKLFFDEVEKEKQTKVLYDKNRSWFGKKVAGLKQDFSNLAGIFYSTKPSEHKSVENSEIPSTFTASPNPLVDLPLVQRNSISIVSAPILFQRNSEQSPTPQSQPPAQPSIAPPHAAPPSSQTISVDTSSRANPVENATVLFSTSPSGPSINPPPAESSSSTHATTTPPTIDTSAPHLEFSVDECSQSLSQEECLVVDNHISLKWFSNSEDLDHFILECTSENSCSDFINGTTSATSTTYIVPKEGIYTFKVGAIDRNGNLSSLSKTVEFRLRPVVINEIAWAGTSASKSQDEWVEIFNPTHKAINLTGFKLRSLTDNKPAINLAGTIPARGFYLIERSDDTTVSDVSASLIASFGSGQGAGLSNSGEVLALEYQEKIIDQTPAVSECSGWCAGDSISHATMERFNPYASGTDKNNWRSASGVFVNGKNADGLAIQGTPGQRNSINYLIDSSGTGMAADKTLKAEDGPFVIPSSFLVPQGVTLTLEPGTVIKFFESASMTIEGTLKAEGTSEKPIVFTSIRDDEFGGDTNKDATSTTPAPGDWHFLKFKNTQATLDHTIFRFGGIPDLGNTGWAIMRVDDSQATIKNSVIEESGAYGIIFNNSTGVLDSNIIRKNKTFNNRDSSGLGTSHSTVDILDNVFEENTFGARLTGDDKIRKPKIEGNTFNKNTQSAIEVVGLFPTFNKNTATNNGTNGIDFDGFISDNYTLEPDLPYVINGITVPEGKTLTIKPGTILKMKPSSSLEIAGILNATGEEDKKILFTSLKDDACDLPQGCTDTNNSIDTPSAGDWNRIYFGPTATSSIIKHSVIRFGGINNLFFPVHGAIVVEDTSITLEDSTIDNNYLVGISLKNSSSTIKNSTIINHREPSTESYGLLLNNSSPVIENTRFINNKTGIQGINSTVSKTGEILFENNTQDFVPSDLLNIGIFLQ